MATLWSAIVKLLIALLVYAMDKQKASHEEARKAINAQEEKRQKKITRDIANERITRVKL